MALRKNFSSDIPEDLYNDQLNRNFQSLDGRRLKVALEGSVELTKPANDEEINFTITHNLGYAPIVVAGVTGTSAIRMLPYLQFNVTSGSLILGILYDAADEENLQFKIVAPSTQSGYASELTYTVRYYLLKDTAT